MNRLILVGNGFDLAYGLKTSYCHFLSDYLSNLMNQFLWKNEYVDPLMEFNWKDKDPFRRNSPFGYENKIPPEVAIENLKGAQNNPNFIVTIKSEFLKETIDKVETFNWVDLENEYFDHLLKCKEENGFNYERVKKLNDEFEFIKIKLEEYLIRHQKEFSEYFLSIDSSWKIFCEKIKSSDLAIADFEDELPKNLHILSFNYTYTLDESKTKCSEIIPTSLNYIHGEIETPKNPIIFGFGDEYDKNYVNFEELKNKDILRHIKSFSYFKTSNYHNLLRFIEADDFQVYIFGHSCGLSDRTMLKHIFEHEKCKSIKIFYHERGENENDFTDKTYELSRHFSDKGSMRKKLVPFEKSVPMPQARIIPR